MRNPSVSSALRSRVLPVAVIVCSAGALVACEPKGPAPASQAGEQPNGDDQVDSQAPAAPSPVDAAGEQAKATYVGMWEAMAKAGETSDWRSPELGKFATDNALTTISRSLYADSFNHVVSRGRPRNNPQVTSVEPPNAPATVMLKDCGDSTDWLQFKEGTNEPVDQQSGGRRSITAEVKHQPDGSWRVTRFAVEGLGTC